MSTSTAEKPADPAAAAGGSKKKMMIIIVLVVVLAVGAGAYFFLFKPSGDDVASAGEEAGGHGAADSREPGEVVHVEPVSVNLAGAHYLRLGFSMQLSTDAGGGHGKFVVANALDVALEHFAGRTIEEVNDPERRQELKEEFLHLLDEAYHGVVMEVYYTDYVTQ